MIKDVLIGSNYKEKVSWMSAKSHSSGRGISWNTARQCLEIPVFGKSGEHGPKTADGGGAEEVLQLVFDKKHNFCILYIVDNLESERAISFWESGANALDCTPGSAAAAHGMRGGEEKTG